MIVVVHFSFENQNLISYNLKSHRKLSNLHDCLWENKKADGSRNILFNNKIDLK